MSSSPDPPAPDEAGLARLERAMVTCSPLQMTVQAISVSTLRVDVLTTASALDAAELISAAVNAAPALCAALREAWGRAARMRAALENVVSAVPDDVCDRAFRPVREQCRAALLE